MKKITNQLRYLTLLVLLFNVKIASAQCPVISNFSFTTGVNGLVAFNNTSTGTNTLTTYSWDFGNGTSSSIANPSVTYTANASYTVCLNAIDVSGCTITFCDTILISNVTTSTCNVTANFNFTTGANGLVIFNNTSTGTSSLTTYNWSFGNGSSSSATNPAYTYTNNGNYIVCLTATDISGCTDTFCNTVYVYTNPTTTCNVNANFTYSVGANGLVSFTNTSTGIDSLSTYLWNGGNGTSIGQWYFPSSVGIGYLSNGNYNVCLTVTSASGCTGTYCNTVSITNVTTNTCNVFANFSFTTSANGLVTFNNISTGTSTFTAYSWDFGNGSSDSSTNPIVTYTANGNYYVCLTATDVSGCTNTFCNTIIISNVTGGICNLTTNYTHTVTSNGVVNFNSISTGINASATYLWNFGDGTTSTIGPNVSHTYISNGAYTVILHINNENISSCNDSIAYSINITNVITGIAFNKLETIDYSIYPNPNNGVFKVKLNTSISANEEINVYDLIGNLVYSTVIDSTSLVKTINLPNVSNGIYFVKVSSNDSQHTKKIIINK
jgi:PKD repeat protein